MMRPYPKWMEALAIVIFVMLIICFIIGAVLHQYEILFSLLTIMCALVFGLFLGRSHAMQKYGGIAIRSENIKDGVYRIENILTGRGLDFRTVILIPKNSRQFYHVADAMKHFPDEAVEVTVEIRNGKIYSYIY